MVSGAKLVGWGAALLALNACGGGESDAPTKITPERAATATRVGNEPARPVTESDLGGLPLYPGADLLQPQSQVTRQGGESSLTTGTFEVGDAPATVADYYRRKLRDLPGSPPVVETLSPAGQLTLLADDARSDRAWQVQISPTGTGSHVQVITVEFPRQ